MMAVRSWVVRQFGAEVLAFETYDQPPPTEGLVRIAVEAAAVNFFDSCRS
jgi:NADPH:quinone reductase-like Zn-dependent oxidoreductase